MASPGRAARGTTGSSPVFSSQHARRSHASCCAPLPQSILSERTPMELSVGIASTDITPQRPCRMGGYNRSEPSDGVLDPIKLYALAAQVGDVPLILIVIDSIMVSEGIRARRASRCDDTPRRPCREHHHLRHPHAFGSRLLQARIRERARRGRTHQRATRPRRRYRCRGLARGGYPPRARLSACRSRGSTETATCRMARPTSRARCSRSARQPAKPSASCSTSPPIPPS